MKLVYNKKSLDFNVWASFIRKDKFQKKDKTTSQKTILFNILKNSCQILPSAGPAEVTALKPERFKCMFGEGSSFWSTPWMMVALLTLTTLQPTTLFPAGKLYLFASSKELNEKECWTFGAILIGMGSIWNPKIIKKINHRIIKKTWLITWRCYWCFGRHFAARNTLSFIEINEILKFFFLWKSIINLIKRSAMVATVIKNQIVRQRFFLRGKSSV